MSAARPLPEPAIDTDAPVPVPAGERLLEVRGLKTYFDTRQGVVKAVDGADFHVDRGEVLGLVGESGCGKSVTSLSIMGLVPKPGKVVAGEILFAGKNIADMKANEVRDLRGEHISMIFQQPTSALNPVYRAGAQIKEVFELHRDWSSEVEEEKVIEMLAKVGIPDPKRRAAAYPHELSGGMAQRVSLCRALITNPELLLMDEPFSALDALTRDEMGLELLNIWEKFRKTVVFVTHSIREAVFLSDRVIVFTPRPAVIGCDLRIDLPRPRMLELQETAEFNRYCAEIRANIGVRGG